MTPRIALVWLSAGGLAIAVASRHRTAGAVRTATPAVDSAASDSLARARQDSINRAMPGYVIDSVHPVEEEIRRFKAKVGGAPSRSLSHASATREALVRRIVADVANADTLDLARTAVTPREFIDLVYPSSPYTRAPYKESPAVIWMQIADPSASGFTRLVRRLAGHPFKYESHSCEAKPDRQGENQLWLNCSVRVTTPGGETATEHWFGTIIERDGRFKVLGFKNQY